MARQSQGAWWIDHNYPPAMIRDSGIMHVEKLYDVYYNDLLSLIMRMIIFDGLPDSIDPAWLKMCLYLGGRAAFFRDTKGDGELRALDCAIAGEPDIYYMPKQVLIVNPAFKGYTYTLDIAGDDVAIVYCRDVDRYQYGRQTGGLYGLISTTAQLLADNTASLNVATKNMRLTNIIPVDDDNTKRSVDIAIKKMYDGDPVIAVQKTLIDKIEPIPLTAQTNTQQLLQLLQTRQYIYAHFYEQLGLKTHDQIKKERLITAELDEGADLALYNVMDVLSSITRGIDDVNRIFGTDITVRLHPLIERTAAEPEQADSQADTAAAAPAEPEPQPPDLLDQIYAAAADRVADMIRTAGRAEDQGGDQIEDDAEQTEDQTEDDAEQADGQTEDDAEQDDDQTETDAEQADDQSGDDAEQTDADQISVEISGDIGGDVQIVIGGDPDAATDISE